MKSVWIGAAAVLVLASAVPVHAQKAKDTVRVPLEAPIQALSYYLDPKPETVFEAEAVFDNLIAFNEKDFKFEPLLAKSWKQVNDKTIEFELRDDIKWHDGEAFNADDVVYTLNWAAGPESKLRFKGNWEFIEKVEKTGPYTVRVIAKEPTPYMLTRLAYLTSMEAEHAHGKAEDKVVYGATKPVGTGMYKVVEIDRNKHILLERFQDYKHGGPAKTASNIGRMELIPMPDAGARTAQFLIKGIDMIRDPGLATAEDLEKNVGAVISLGQGTSYLYMAIDAKGRTGVKPLTDVRVRKAMLMAINRADLVKFLTHGRSLSNGKPVMIPDAMCWDFQAGCEHTVKPYAYDLAAAKKLMADAGYADGFDLEITTFVHESVKGVAQIIANQLRQIGIRATTQPTDTGAYRKKQGDGKIQVMVGAWPGGGNPDVQGTMEFIYAVPPSRDYSGDADMIKTAEETLTIMDPDLRKKAGRKVFDRSTEMAYFVPVAPNLGTFVHTSELALDPGAFGPYGINPQGMRWK